MSPSFHEGDELVQEVFLSDRVDLPEHRLTAARRRRRNMDRAAVRLEHAERALNRTFEIEGLEMRGRGGAWYPVTSVSFSGDTMRLRSEHVAVPTEVRYGWGDFKPGNLANRYGLPLVPFWLKIENQ